MLYTALPDCKTEFSIGFILGCFSLFQSKRDIEGVLVV